MLVLERCGAEPSPALNDAPGGFFWWYADVINEQGDGLVCIWSWGLPFLPGRASAWRAGRPQTPASRPSLNLAIYRNHQQIAYHLLEVDPQAASWSADRWRVGRSELRLDRSAEGAVLHADLHLPVPGDHRPLTGSFVLRGPVARWGEVPEPAPDAHRWAPLLGPCHATVDLRVGDEELLRVEGVGYHDRNACQVALDALGMEHWIWGRSAAGDSTVLYYLSFPAAPEATPSLLVALGGPDGRFRFAQARCELSSPRRGTFGMPWWGRLRVEGLPHPLEVEVERPLDDGPFYLRAMTRASWGGATGPGFIELCRPARVDRPLLRPLVQMAVQQERGPNSMWLPLFCGPYPTRVRRLWRWWCDRGTR